MKYMTNDRYRIDLSYINKKSLPRVMQIKLRYQKEQLSTLQPSHIHPPCWEQYHTSQKWVLELLRRFSMWPTDRLDNLTERFNEWRQNELLMHKQIKKKMFPTEPPLNLSILQKWPVQKSLIVIPYNDHKTIQHE